MKFGKSMSRLVKKVLKITAGASVTETGDVLVFKGPKGEEKVRVPAGVTVRVTGEDILVAPINKEEGTPAAGTLWSLAKNALEGVTVGFLKVLEIEGVGYRATLEGKDLVLHLGYAQPVHMAIPAGITIAVEKNTVKISGIEKEVVGRVAAEIRALKKPEPYKGKGIHYRGEVIQRKVGKKAGTATAA